MTTLDGWLWFDAGVLAYSTLVGLRWILHTLLDWYAARRSRRVRHAYRHRLNGRT